MPKTKTRSFVLDFEKPLIELETQIDEIQELAGESEIDVTQQLHSLRSRADQLRAEIFGSLTAAQKLQIARHPRRPSTLDYVQMITDEWIELHGDRGGYDDPALVGGVARLQGRPVLIIGHQKGRDTKDNVARNFGMASPGGYRKAIRLMQHANRFHLPILTFIDTPGAWAGVEAEKLGQGEAIAYNLREMFALEVPIITTVIGEGGSGGALGIGVSDRLLMFNHSVYTVATPEACAAILWKDASKSEQACLALRITATDLKALGIIDQILPESHSSAHRDPLGTAQVLKEALIQNLNELLALTPEQRKAQRYQKFRQIGIFGEGN